MISVRGNMWSNSLLTIPHIGFPGYLCSTNLQLCFRARLKIHTLSLAKVLTVSLAQLINLTYICLIFPFSSLNLRHTLKNSNTCNIIGVFYSGLYNLFAREGLRKYVEMFVFRFHLNNGYVGPIRNVFTFGHLHSIKWDTIESYKCDIPLRLRTVSWFATIFVQWAEIYWALISFFGRSSLVSGELWSCHCRMRGRLTAGDWWYLGIEFFVVAVQFVQPEGR